VGGIMNIFLRANFLKRLPKSRVGWMAGMIFLGMAMTQLPSVRTEEPQNAGTDPAQTSSHFVTLKEIMVKGNTLTVKMSDPTPYNVFKVSAPDRLVLELSNTENNWKKKEVSLNQNEFFTKVRAAQFQNEPVKIARIVIELKTPVDFETKTEGNLIRLVARKSAESSPSDQTQNTEPAIESMASAPTPPEAQGVDPAPSTNNGESAANPNPSNSQVSPAPGSESQETEEVQTSEKKTQSKAKVPTLASDNPSSLFGRQLVTLDFYDIDVKELFKILADKSGVNVVFSNGIQGTVSIQLKDVSFKDAVDTILALKSLKLVAMGKNIVQLMTPVEFDQYRINAISVTKIFPVNYAKAADVNNQLGSIVATLGGKGKAIVDDRTNSIIVTDTPEGIETITKLIMDLDKPAPQVMIEAKIVQVSVGNSFDLGITWGAAYTDQSGNQMITIGASKSQATPDPSPGSGGGPGLMTQSPLNPSGGNGLETGGAGFSPGQGLGLSFGFVKDVVRLNAALSALQQKNKSKLLSNPKIATLNNQPATIKSQVSTPYITTQTQLTNAGTLSSQVVNQALSGITLSVTPTINADGRITMKIVPDITSSQPTSIGVPQTTSQQANTTVIVKDGETFVIGGLISEQDSNQKAYIPILGSIPIIGYLFKKTDTAKSRSELLVFVTPRIIPY